MIVLIAGATHTGKTAFAQRIMEKYKYPYFSLDHLKMGLIRSGQTSLKVTDDEKLTEYLWEIIREIIKTAIENEQNLIIEGCYIPFDWRKDFDEDYLRQIKYYCIIMSADYIENKFGEIIKYESVIEKRYYPSNLDKDKLIEENRKNLEMCLKYHLEYICVNDEYNLDIDL